MTASTGRLSQILARGLLAVAAVALVAGLVRGAIPVKVYPVNGPAAARPEKVSCGTAFSETKWSNDDACEGPLSGQAGVIFMAFGLGVVCFILGAGVLAFGMNR